MSGRVIGVGMLLERLGDHPPDERGAERGTFDILAGDEFCDHLVTGALGAKTEFLHPLDQFALGVACRRLGLFLFEADFLHREFLTGDKRGQDRLLCLGKRVHGMPAGFGQLPAGCGIFLATGIEEDF